MTLYNGNIFFRHFFGVPNMLLLPLKPLKDQTDVSLSSSIQFPGFPSFSYPTLTLSIFFPTRERESETNDFLIGVLLGLLFLLLG